MSKEKTSYSSKKGQGLWQCGASYYQVRRVGSIGLLGYLRVECS